MSDVREKYIGNVLSRTCIQVCIQFVRERLDVKQNLKLRNCRDVFYQDIQVHKHFER